MKPTFRFCIAAALLTVSCCNVASGAEQDLSINARLLAAARNGDAQGVARALASGASPNARNRLGETALVVALKRNDVVMAQAMVDAGTDVNQAAVNGVTPLMDKSPCRVTFSSPTIAPSSRATDSVAATVLILAPLQRVPLWLWAADR